MTLKIDSHLDASRDAWAVKCFPVREEKHPEKNEDQTLRAIPETSAGYQDEKARMSRDVTELRQSLPVVPGPPRDGLPAYSGPYFPEIRPADPKNILKSGKLHPELVRRVERLIENAQRNGLNVYVSEGFRSEEQQMKLLHSGRGVTRAKPGYSFHNYGLAVDVVFQDKKGRPSWREEHDWKKLGQLGKEVGLEWGGDWKSLRDRPHFQLVPNGEIGHVRKAYRQGGLQKVWQTIAG
ncbi:MAG: M15 family metallopeptidase [bacterium]